MRSGFKKGHGSLRPTQLLRVPQIDFQAGVWRHVAASREVGRRKGKFVRNGFRGWGGGVETKSIFATGGSWSATARRVCREVSEKEGPGSGWDRNHLSGLSGEPLSPRVGHQRTYPPTSDPENGPVASGSPAGTRPKAAPGFREELATPLNGRLLIGLKLSFSRPGNLIVEHAQRLVAGRPIVTIVRRRKPSRSFFAPRSSTSRGPA